MESYIARVAQNCLNALVVLEGEDLFPYISMDYEKCLKIAEKIELKIGEKAEQMNYLAILTRYIEENECKELLEKILYRTAEHIGVSLPLSVDLEALEKVLAQDVMSGNFGKVQNPYTLNPGLDFDRPFRKRESGKKKPKNDSLARVLSYSERQNSGKVANSFICLFAELAFGQGKLFGDIMQTGSPQRYDLNHKRGSAYDNAFGCDCYEQPIVKKGMEDMRAKLHAYATEHITGIENKNLALLPSRIAYAAASANDCDANGVLEERRPFSVDFKDKGLNIVPTYALMSAGCEIGWKNIDENDKELSGQIDRVIELYAEKTLAQILHDTDKEEEPELKGFRKTMRNIPVEEVWDTLSYMVIIYLVRKGSREMFLSHMKIRQQKYRKEHPILDVEKKRYEKQIAELTEERNSLTTQVKHLERECQKEPAAKVIYDTEAKDALKKERKRNDALLERIAYLEGLVPIEAEDEQEHPKLVCDDNGRYLFLCEHNGYATKLLKQFPNSRISDSYNLSPANMYKVDAVVCITPSVSHSETYRLKGTCSKNGIPFVSVNYLNFDRVRQTLAENGFIAPN